MRNSDHYEELYDFQKEGVEFLRNRRAALLADDMGTGKSVQSIVAAQGVGADNILIICPASVKYNWVKECVKWGYTEADCLVIEKKTVKLIPEHSGIFIINYDLIHRRDYAKVLTKKRFDVLIADECHYVKNHKALRTKALYNSGGYVDLSIYTWMLSGTPVLNRPVELHAMLRRLAPETLGEFTNYIAYTRRYCQGYDGKWGWDASGACNVEELAGRLSGFMLRRTKDCLTELPERILRPVYLPLTPQIEKHLFKERSGDESGRRLLGVAKVPDVVNYVKDILESENKVVVFAYHTDVISELSRLLHDFGTVVIQGSVAANRRQQVIDEFVTRPKCRVFIGQIDAAGEGIDGLQGVCSNIVFAEMHYVPGKNLQAIGRVHRNGQKKKVVVDFLFVEGSMDEQVFNKNLKKAEVIQTLNGDENELFIIETEKPNEGAKMQEKQINNKSVTAVVTVNIADYSMEKLLNATTLLEKIGCVSNIGLTFGVHTSQEPVAEDTQEPIKETKPKKSSRTRAVKAKPVEPEVDTVEETVIEPIAEKPKQKPKQSFGEYVSGVANKISMSLGEGNRTQINEYFAEVQARFIKTFPKYSNLLALQSPKDQETARQILEDFLAEKGIV